MGEPSLRVSRRYRPAHNIGHFRYLECRRRSEGGRPLGDITLWDGIYFPFDPAMRGRAELSGMRMERWGPAWGQEIEEAYSCDAGGAATVRIANVSSG
jgi:molecular chaperone DnaK